MDDNISENNMNNSSGKTNTSKYGNYLRDQHKARLSKLSLVIKFSFPFITTKFLFPLKKNASLKYKCILNQ